MRNNHLFQKIALFYLLFFLLSNISFSQVKYRVYLFANTADITKNTEYFNQFNNLISSVQEPFTLILNGDLIKGSNPKKNTAADSIRVRTMLGSVAGLKQGEIIIVPGDRDWADSG